MNDDLPQFTKYTNRNGSPIVILLMQALIGTVLISMNLFIPTMNQFYWIFQVQAAQLILMMYLMVFLSVIRLRYTQAGVQRIYKIPGGKFGVWLVAGTGATFCVVAFLLGFIPPPEYHFDEKTYALTLLTGIVLFSAPPFLWQWWRKKDLSLTLKCA